MDPAVVVGMDQLASDKVMMGNQLVLVGQRLWVRRVSHLVLWIELFLPGFQAFRARFERN